MGWDRVKEDFVDVDDSQCRNFNLRRSNHFSSVKVLIDFYSLPAEVISITRQDH